MKAAQTPNILYSKINLVNITKRNISKYALINKDVSLSTTKLPQIQNRRTFMGWMTFMTVTLTQETTAWALIPNDDDTDLILKAKAERRAKIKNELETEKKFIRAEKFSSRNEEQNLKPIQTAIYYLAYTGNLLENDNLNEISKTLSKEEWITDFEAASRVLCNGNIDAEKQIENIINKIDNYKSASLQGDLIATKKEFVSVVDEFEKWATTTKISEKVKGL